MKNIPQKNQNTDDMIPTERKGHVVKCIFYSYYQSSKSVSIKTKKSPRDDVTQAKSWRMALRCDLKFWKSEFICDQQNPNCKVFCKFRSLDIPDKDKAESNLSRYRFVKITK